MKSVGFWPGVQEIFRELIVDAESWESVANHARLAYSERALDLMAIRRHSQLLDAEWRRQWNVGA